LKNYFTKTEKILWLTSVTLITLSFLIFSRDGYLNLAASVLGVTSIMICAKGNPLGQLMMVFFAMIYGYISYSFSYYGEMLTYLGMTGPMALFSFISWIRNPFSEKSSEVKVNTISRAEKVFMVFLTAVVTALFYFILKYFKTANLLPSTLSVATSFAAVYLTFRRSAYFSLVYASNDIVLIVLWILASMKDISCISVVICFTMFLLNDIYAFISWLKMRERQSEKENENEHQKNHITEQGL